MNWQRVLVRLKRDAADAALIVLAWAVYVEIAVTDAQVDKTAAFALGFFWVVPLLFRARVPLLAVAVPFGALALMNAIDPTGLQNLFLPLVSGLAAAACAGAIRDRRQAVAALGILLAVVGYIAWSDPKGSTASDYVFLTLFFGASWLIGSAFAIRTEQTKELRARVRAAETSRSEVANRAAAEERARIARELHDVVAHSVSVMVVQASGVRRLLSEDQAREREALLSVEQIGRQALSEMRRMLGVMRTGAETTMPALTPQPGLEHLDRLIAQIEEAGLAVTLHVEGDRLSLPPGVDLSAYRIVQEGLTNALKHAKGSHADVIVRYAGDGVELEILDDGPGVPNGDGMGHGLVGMRERVALYGGTLEAGPRPQGGFVLRARLPLEARS